MIPRCVGCLPSNSRLELAARGGLVVHSRTGRAATPRQAASTLMIEEISHE